MIDRIAAWVRRIPHAEGERYIVIVRHGQEVVTQIASDDAGDSLANELVAILRDEALAQGKGINMMLVAVRDAEPPTPIARLSIRVAPGDDDSDAPGALRNALAIAVKQSHDSHVLLVGSIEKLTSGYQTFVDKCLARIEQLEGDNTALRDLASDAVETAETENRRADAKPDAGQAIVEAIGKHLVTKMLPGDIADAVHASKAATDAAAKPADA